MTLPTRRPLPLRPPVPAPAAPAVDSDGGWGFLFDGPPASPAVDGLAMVEDLDGVFDASVIERAGGRLPRSWDALVGQDVAKEVLRGAARASRLLGEPMPHVMLASGAPGVGKTALAMLLCAELGQDVAVLTGTATVEQAWDAVAGLDGGGVLFVDEAHQLARAADKGEWLLTLMEQGLMPDPASGVLVPVAAVTVVLATTDRGSVRPAILSRVGLEPALVAYSRDECVEIGLGMAAGSFSDAGLPLPSDRVLGLVADAACLSPRRVRTVLEGMRLHAVASGLAPEDGEYPVGDALRWSDLTPDGLTREARAYLVALRTVLGGKAGQRSIAQAIGAHGGADETEALLMGLGLISRTGAGRVLTAAGEARADGLAAA